jgi:hypothetical protein
MKLYKCSYVTGGGVIYSDGEWSVKKTAKTITLEKVSHKNEIFSMHSVGDKMRVGEKTSHEYTDWEDDTFTVYFNRSGIPSYFEPIK